MAFFDKLPYMTYELEGQEFVIRDLFRKASFISEYKPYTDLYSSYTIVDGDTPSTIAQEYYESHEYYWVVLVFNEIHNMNYDWPLDQSSLHRFCAEKYGETNMYLTRHWEIDGYVSGEVKDFGSEYTPPDSPSELASAVSFYEFEERINDAKRKINILRPELLSEFVAQYKEAMNG